MDLEVELYFFLLGYICYGFFEWLGHYTLHKLVDSRYEDYHYNYKIIRTDTSIAQAFIIGMMWCVLLNQWRMRYLAAFCLPNILCYCLYIYVHRWVHEQRNVKTSAGLDSFTKKWHKLHHEYPTTNFGVLTTGWDCIFGTADIMMPIRPIWISIFPGFIWIIDRREKTTIL